MAGTIQIEIVYALEDEQFLYREEVEEGTTVIEALKASQLLQDFPELTLDKVGIFGRLVAYDTLLKPQDRIEVYRPLKADPKERRRKRVERERKAEQVVGVVKN